MNKDSTEYENIAVGVHNFNTNNFLMRKGIAIWMTGLSGSGKTTLSIGLKQALAKKGIPSYIIDGDILRNGINKDLGFSLFDRKENIRRAAEISKLFVKLGFITINSFISPTNEVRDMAKSIIGDRDFKLAHINTSIEICEKRDTKGLYKKARKGEIENFTGISSHFETPEHADISINTDDSFANNIEQFTNFVLSLGYFETNPMVGKELKALINAMNKQLNKPSDSLL